MGREDLGAERQAEAAAAALRGGERERGAPHRVLVHARPAVEDAEERSRPSGAGSTETAISSGRASGLGRVLQEVQEHLLHLRGIEDGRRRLGRPRGSGTGTARRTDSRNGAHATGSGAGAGRRASAA